MDIICPIFFFFLIEWPDSFWQDMVKNVNCHDVSVNPLYLKHTLECPIRLSSVGFHLPGAVQVYQDKMW